MSDSLLNPLDRLRAWLNPKRGFEIARYRAAINSFEAAGRGNRLKNWKTRGGSINEDTRKGLTALRARSRDLAQNNPWAAAAHREIPNNIIASGITPHVGLPDKEARAPMEGELKAFFDTRACDWYGQTNLYGLQRQIAKAVVESGESLVLRRRVPGNRVPMQIQVLESDHLDHLKDGVVDKRTRIIQGVEFRNGKVVAYWIYPEHPGESTLSFRSVESQRFPAADVIHVYRVDRPGQVRGVPWGAPCLLKVKGMDELDDAQLVRQKIAACFAVLWTDPSGDVDDDAMAEQITPGLVQKMPAGSEIEFGSPPAAEGYSDAHVLGLHDIATGYGVPYSVLTGDVRQTNFSSGRMADRAFNRNVKAWQDDIIINGLCERLAEWFIEAVTMTGRVEPAPIKWQKPKREMTDPAKEIPPIIAKVRAGFCSLPEAIRQEGYDPDDVMDEIIEFNQLLDENGLVFDTDARKVSAAGLMQVPAEANSDDDED